MRKQPNVNRYFSGNAITRLPIYKVLAGGTAALLCVGLGVGVTAAALAPAPAEMEPAPVVEVSTAETATPSPTPEPTPTPAPMEVHAEVTVVQQDVGVLLYTVSAGEEPVLKDPENSANDVTVEEKEPLLGVALNILLTDANGKETECPLDTASGTALAEDMKPGEYTVTVPAVEGYIMPDAQKVTVKERVEYHADVEAVKEKIVQASQVVESQEDSSYGVSTVVAEEIKDTVSYADSAKTQVSTSTVYTAQTSSRGYLLLSDGTETPYVPLFDEAKNLTGAKRDGGFLPAAARGMDSRIVFLGRGAGQGSVTPLAAGGTENADEPAVSSLEPGSEPPVEPTADPAADPTAEPTETPPAPTEAPTQEPTAEPTPTPEPAQTETPAPATPTPTPAPEATPTPTPAAPTPDRFAAMPESIEAAKLAEYGFAVSKSETPVYEYTGWQTIDGKTYYYDPSNHQPVTGSQVIQGNVYTFAADGALNQTARGVDVSKFQGTINWNAVAADGITFAIIRCGYRGYGSGALVEDSTFRANIKGATAAGLRVGVYFYSQAITEEEAVEEASMVISLCSGYGLPCGVYYDTEKVAGDTGRADGISAAQRTACAVAFCETIRDAGYAAGVYSYASWFYNQLNFANISKYRIWIAQYRDTLSFNYHYNMWQYTSTGKVNGIPKAVDMNLG